jgi:hypothetical protein
MANFLTNVGDVFTAGADNAGLGAESSGAYNLHRSQYTENDSTGNMPTAAVDGKIKAPGSYSLFNPFNIFRYSKLGLNSGTYARDLQLDDHGGGGGGPAFSDFTGGTGTAPIDADALTQRAGFFKEFTEQQKEIENPTASNIIRWAQRNGRDGQSGPGSAVPYASADFIWCKYYGKVPNNRLVTLRRYPIPVSDDIRIAAEKSPLIPIAQAVTWYGEDIGNNLNNILNLSWGLNWEPITAEMNDLNGNEITLKQLTDAIGFDADKNPKAYNILKTQVFSGGGKVDLLKLSGYDEAIQNYIKNAYADNGPYWNRVLGPVNVINKTNIRQRGFKDQKPIKLVFEYSLRAYGGINPKIAFLDLLGNFLSLTYNTASFWGGGIRYFQQTGVTLPSLGMENDMLDGDMTAAVANGIEQILGAAGGNARQLVSLVEDLAKGDTGGGTSTEEQEAAIQAASDGFKANAFEKLITPRMGKLMRMPLIFRSILDGREVGEWHVTVGNPMQPMAMIGNLCLDTVALEVGEVLGLDDFPTEFKFTVSLLHGRPRAKQDIESIFNNGSGWMTFSQLPSPSSAKNSYGDGNTAAANRANNNADGVSVLQESKPIKTGDAAVLGISGKGTLEDMVSEYSRQVRNMYGSAYGSSEILTDYFTELKTKD